MSGFVVPLEGDGKSVTQFLLVPHFGACIRTPPPPSNQIVSVRAPAKMAKLNRLCEIGWVTGRMKTERTRNDITSAGYMLEATKVEPF